MCFQGSPRSWGLAPQVGPPSLLPGPQFPGQGRVPPTPSGLANTFPGQRSTARGEGSFRSVSAPQRGAMLGSPSRGHLAPPMGVPCWGHLAKGTWHLPWACHAGVTQLRAPGTSHGRAMLGSPSRGHLAPPMGPRRTVAGGALACEKPNRRAQLALVEGSKQPREAFASSCWAAPR